jgi:hypothetical protein
MATSNPMQHASIGCRSHSGWAVLVAIAGHPDSPKVVDRRRIEIADPTIRGSKQPYHAAEPLELPDAEALIKRCAASTARLAQQALRSAINDLRARGYQATCFGITVGSGRALPGLPAILKSHALLHTAEGEFFRNALLNAAERCTLALLGVKEKEVYDRAIAHLRIPHNELQRRVADLGKAIGPPWSQDQKYSALAAWLALAHYRSER